MAGVSFVNRDAKNTSRAHGICIKSLIVSLSFPPDLVCFSPFWTGTGK